MKVVVTGSTGFLGKEICKQLREKGFRVKEFSRSRGFDLLKKEDCEKACEKADYVVHSAAIISEREKNIMEAVNVQGTKNILEAAAKARVKHFLHVSSTSVYGMPKGELTEESEKHPKYLYEKSKLEAEKVVLSFQEMLPVTIIRPPIIFGANKTWEKIIEYAKSKSPVPGDGKNPFQFGYIKNIASAIVFLLGKEEAFSEAYLVADDEKKSFEEVVKLFRRELGLSEKTVKIPLWIALTGAYGIEFFAKARGKYTSYSPENVKRLAKRMEYDISKIKNLGWKPKYGVEEAVKEVVGELKNEGKL